MYASTAQCRALIAAGSAPTAPPRLSRRRRLIPLAVDVDEHENVAAVTHLRRGVGFAWQDVDLFYRADGEWQRCGGGSSSCDLDEVLLERRPAHELGTPLRADGASGCATGGDGILPPIGRRHWLQGTELVAALEVAEVRVSLRRRDRRLPVPWHGRLVVAWRGHRPPRVTALDGEGRPLAALRLRS